MKINYKKTLAIGLSFMIFLPLIASAQGAFYGFIPIGCADSASSTPCGFDEFAALINKIINWFIGIAGVVAAITFSWAGAQILLHPEEPAKIQEGWDMLKKTAWGILIILIAWLAVHTIVDTLVVKNKDSALRFLKTLGK